MGPRFLLGLRRRPESARRLGRRGERFACRALRRQGYRLLVRRWRTPRGEVDLLMERGRRVWLVEVKTTRRAGARGPRVRRGQRRRLRRVARWAARLPSLAGRPVGILDVRVRFGGTRPRLDLRTDVRDVRKGR